MKLTIEKAIYGGAGLARIPAEDAAAGKAVFVSGALPGEVVEARITEQKRGFATAELVQVLEPAPRRIAPVCPHFAQCGGCHYQQAAYGAQLEMKMAILRESLGRAGLRALPPIIAHGATTEAQAWQYRNRIRLHVTRNERGLALGYKERASSRVLPVAECRVAAPLLWRAAMELQQADALLRSCSEIELFCDAEETQVQASLFLAAAERDLVAGFHELCAAWQRQVPQLVGAGLYAPQSIARKRDAAAGQPKIQPVTSWGSGTLAYVVGGVVGGVVDGQRYRVTRGAFFQVNRYRIAELLQLVTQGRSGSLAWDLYAGAGLFSCALASSFAQVVAVEIASPANQDLEHNLAQASNATAHTVVAATTLEFLAGQAKSRHRQRPQLVVLDPPRAGLGAEVCRLLAQVEAPQMVYVSCDPATLARDLAALIESGYQLQQVHLVDLFPQTFHLETVAILTHS